VARVNLELFFKKLGVFLKIRGPRLDFTEGQGANCKIGGDFSAWNYFPMGKFGGPSPRCVDRWRGSGPWWTEVAWWHLARAWPPATLEHGSSSTGAQQRGEHGDPSSGLTGARMVMERQRDGGDEWQQLELSVRAKEGAKELRREEERGGEGWGCSSPFIGAEGAPGRGNGQW
jgi:hypothetical protein